MEEGGQQKGQVDASVSDDAAYKGNYITDEEHSQNGKKQAGKPEIKGWGRAGFTGGGPGKITIYRQDNDQPDQGQFQGESSIDGLPSGTG
jgi:hypothetical protein